MRRINCIIPPGYRISSIGKVGVIAVKNKDAWLVVIYGVPARSRIKKGVHIISLVMLEEYCHKGRTTQ